jgi:hypothetical protein
LKDKADLLTHSCDSAAIKTRDVSTIDDDLTLSDLLFAKKELQESGLAGAAGTA